VPRMQHLGELLRQPSLAVPQRCQAHYIMLLNAADSTAAAGAYSPAGTGAFLSPRHLQRRKQEQQLQALDVAVGMTAHKLALNLGGVTAAQQMFLQVRQHQALDCLGYGRFSLWRAYTTMPLCCGKSAMCRWEI
jgi:hypothetical protein